jgi:ketosteroid isomerase-like protein
MAFLSARSTTSFKSGRKPTILGVAKSIWQARREAAAKLDEQLRENAETTIEDSPWWAKVADGQALRGIPAISRHAAGSALDGISGSDGHLNEMDRR